MLGDNEPHGWPTSTYAQNQSDAAAKALNGGCDLDDGNQFYQPRSKGGNGGLPDALAAGLTDVAHVDAALTRVLTNERFRTGQADPLEGQPYTKIDASAINATAHQEANLDMATQSMVLLRNEPPPSATTSQTTTTAGAKILPLKASSHLAVLGPHAVSHRDLLSDYIVDQLCFKGPIRGGECWPTIGEAFTTAHTANGGKVTVAQGVDMASTEREGIPAAIAAAQAADSIVLCLGIGNAQEHEGQDRKHTSRPGLHEEFTKQGPALGKPTVLVLV
jgi:beta-glucosidase